MIVISREELYNIFSRLPIKTPNELAKVSELELSLIIGVDKNKLRDYHFSEWFKFIFSSVEDVINFVKSNPNCRKCKSTLEAMTSTKEDHSASKWWWCETLARHRRSWGGYASYQSMEF